MLTDVFRLSRPAVFSHFLFLIFLFFWLSDWAISPPTRLLPTSPATDTAFQLDPDKRNGSRNPALDETSLIYFLRLFSSFLSAARLCKSLITFDYITYSAIAIHFSLSAPNKSTSSHFYNKKTLLPFIILFHKPW